MMNKPDEPNLPESNDKKDSSKPQSDPSIEGLEGSSAGAAARKKPAPKTQLPSDDAIDLGSPGEGVDLSGISVIEWASLAEASQSPGSGGSSEPKFDSPSDADLVAQLADHKDTPAGHSAPRTMVQPPSHIEELPAEPASTGGGQAPPSGQVEAAQAGKQPEPSNADIFLPEPGFPAEPPPFSSAVDLGAAPPDSSAALGSQVDVQEEDAIFLADSGTRTPTGAEAAEAASSEDSAIDLTGSAFVFKDEPIAPAEKSKSEDSAIDLTEAAVVEELAPAAAPPSESGILLTEDAVVDEPSPTIKPTNTDSGIDLVEGVFVEAPSSGPAPAPAGDSGIELVGDALIVEEAAEEAARPVEKADSGIDLVAAAGVEQAAPASPPPQESGIVLTREALVSEDSPSSVKMKVGSDSDIKITPEEAGKSSAGAAASVESGIDLLAEDVILEETAGPPSGSGSSRDLIAEGLESGVDLKKQKKGTPPSSDEDALDEFLRSVGTEDQSSSVDLGSVHNFPVFKEEEKVPSAKDALGPDSGVVLEGIEEDAAAAGIDLESATASGVAPKPAATAPAESGIELSPTDLAEGDEVEVGEGDEVLEEEEEETPRKKTKAVKDEGEDEAPAKQPKPRGRAGAWLGGAVLGAVIGAAACVGVWVFGIEPPSSLREMVGVETKKPDTGKGPVVPPAETKTFADAMDQIKAGNLDKVNDADLAKANEANADHLVARAEHEWLSYLKKERAKDAKAPLKADAEPVKKALADLNKAVEMKNADALFLRGQIHEMTGNREEAKKDYERGKKDFAGDAETASRFDAALLVLELSAPKVARLLPPGMSPRLLALLILTNFQPPPGGAPAGEAATPEAGYRFWQSIKLAREAMRDPSKWSEAIKALDEARERHDLRRFARPRKQQNPLSDPREEIFLKATEELKDYWTMLARLQNKDYLKAEPKDRVKVVDDLLAASNEEARSVLLKTLADKLAKDKKVEKADDLIKLVSDERKKSADQITTLEENLEKSKKDLTATKKDLETATKDLTDTKDLLKASAAREKDLQGKVDLAMATLKEVGDAVGVKVNDLKTSTEPLVKEVRTTKRVALVVDPKGTIRRLEGELESDRAKLKQRWTPEEMLPSWLAILESDRSRADLGAKALVDASRVLDDPASTELQKGKALAIRGLVLRNEDKFAEAVPVLQKAKEALADSRGEWLKKTEEALAESSNPAADLLRRADAMLARGQEKEALELLNRAIKVASGKKGALLARRAILSLEAARAKGAVKSGDPLIRSAQADADEAVKEGLAEGHYVAGRLAEELGKLDEAAKSYQAALDAHKGLDGAGARYRVALARVLLKSRSAETPGVRPLPPADRVGKGPAKKEKALASVRSLSAVDFLSLMMVLTFQADDLPLTGPKVREAEKLADEVLKLGDKAPFDVRAQALAVKGLYTRALSVYLNGLRDKGLLGASHANAMLELLANHPVLKRPESLAIPEPVEGEKHYASGLNFFFARQYGEAEKEFLAAIENDNGDARYYYFLGLSRLVLGKSDATEDFDQAARLERRGRPDRAAVSRALERVQGSMRQTLNSIRNRPVKERAK